MGSVGRGPKTRHAGPFLFVISVQGEFLLKKSQYPCNFGGLVYIGGSISENKESPDSADKSGVTNGKDFMSTNCGIWDVSRGKGDRIYINCNNSEAILHPGELCGVNGLGMYGYEHLKDLAVAILRFEKAENESNSIMSKVKEPTEP